MRKITTIILALGFAGAASMSAAATFAEIDLNSDGAVSQDEFLVAYPDATAEIWANVDANGDGTLSEEEVVAAQDAGVLPAG